jgi:hypothetical protein
MKRKNIFTLVWPSGQSTGLSYYCGKEAKLTARYIGALVRCEPNPNWRDDPMARQWAA